MPNNSMALTPAKIRRVSMPNKKRQRETHTHTHDHIHTNITANQPWTVL